MIYCDRPYISTIIPAYNESGRVGRTIKSVIPYVDEVIVIDDNSRDSTAKEAKEAGGQVIQQPSNMGYVAAIKRGFAEAYGEIIVTIDADGEFPPERILDLIQPIIEDRADMVQGRRAHIPRLFERFLSWLAGSIGPVGDSGTGFRALKLIHAQNIKLRGTCICGIFSLEVLSMGGRIVDIPIQMEPLIKPRRIAWHHFIQFIYLIPWILK